MTIEPGFDAARQRRLMERIAQHRAKEAARPGRAARPSYPRWALRPGEVAAARSDERRVLGAPPVCLLERALGREVPCQREACLFHRVPSVRMECAVEWWAPAIARNPRLAKWFLDLRNDAGKESG